MWLHWLVVLAQNHQTWVVDGTNVNLLVRPS